MNKLYTMQTQTRMHARTHARMHARTHARTHVHTHTHTCTHTHTHARTHTHRQAPMCNICNWRNYPSHAYNVGLPDAQLQVQLHTRAHIHTHAHTHTTSQPQNVIQVLPVQINEQYLLAGVCRSFGCTTGRGQAASSCSLDQQATNAVMGTLGQTPKCWYSLGPNGHPHMV